MISLTEKLWGIYRESRDNGLKVSLTVSVHNVFKSVPTGVAVLNGRRWRGRRHEYCGGQHEQHGRRDGRAQQVQNAGVSNTNATPKPSYASVVRSPPSPLQPRVTKRAKRPYRGVTRATNLAAAAQMSSLPLTHPFPPQPLP